MTPRQVKENLALASELGDTNLAMEMAKQIKIRDLWVVDGLYRFMAPNGTERLRIPDYKGICAVCQAPYQPGDPIYWRTSSGSHKACWEAEFPCD